MLKHSGLVVSLDKELGLRRRTMLCIAMNILFVGYSCYICIHIISG